MGQIPALADCGHGLRPVEYNVIVIPEKIEEVTKGGIILTPQTKETEGLASVRGRLVAVSPHAFSYAENWPEGSIPAVGDVVLFAKYGGTLTKGRDGNEYRVLKDKDVIAVVA